MAVEDESGCFAPTLDSNVLVKLGKNTLRTTRPNLSYFSFHSLTAATARDAAECCDRTKNEITREREREKANLLSVRMFHGMRVCVVRS